MRGCLSVGEGAARGLAAGLEKKLVGIHHMVMFYFLSPSSLN